MIPLIKRAPAGAAKARTETTPLNMLPPPKKEKNKGNQHLWPPQEWFWLVLQKPTAPLTRFVAGNPWPDNKAVARMTSPPATPPKHKYPRIYKQLTLELDFHFQFSSNLVLQLQPWKLSSFSPPPVPKP